MLRDNSHYRKAARRQVIACCLEFARDNGLKAGPRCLLLRPMCADTQSHFSLCASYGIGPRFSVVGYFEFNNVSSSLARSRSSFHSTPVADSSLEVPNRFESFTRILE